MKTSFNLFLLFFLLISRFGYSQTFEFAPIGAKWYFYVEHFSGTPPGPYIDIVESVKDTTIDGKSCKLLSNDMIFYQNPNDSIFIHVGGSNFALLYDFSKTASETFYSDYCEEDIEIESEEIIDVNGSDRRRHKYVSLGSGETTCNWNNYVIEGIGSTYGEFVPSKGLADEDQYYLQCYEDDNVGQYKYRGEECGVLSLNYISSTKEVNVYPSVFNSFIQIHNQTSQRMSSVSVYSINGALMDFSDKLSRNEKLDLAFLEKGVYILSIKMDDGSVNQQKIIKL